MGEGRDESEKWVGTGLCRLDKVFLFLSQENGLLFHVLKRGSMIRFAFHKDHPSCSAENKSEGASGCWKPGCSLLATRGAAG